MAGNFFRGTSVEQDGRWGKSDEKLMAKMAKNGMFAPILDTKVNLKKVNLDVINKWITQKIIEVVGFEDDILISMVINMLQSAEVDGRKMQLDVTGFLEKQSGAFVAELWTLLVDAQDQPSGIPTVFLQKKKEEIMQRQGASNRFGPPTQGGAVSAPIAQVRTDGVALTENNATKLTSKEESSRDVKSPNAEGESRKRERSPSPGRRTDRRDERRREHSPERRSRRDSSPDRRRRSLERRDRSPDRRDRDRRDSRSGRDDRGGDRDRDGRADRRRDSRERRDDKRDDKRDDRRTDKDHSPDRRRDRDRDSHRGRRSPDRRSHSPARRSHRDSRDHRRRDRSPSPRRKSDRRSPDRRTSRSSRSPERRKRADSSDREDKRTEAKEVRSRDSSADRDLDHSGKWVKSEDVEGAVELQGGVVIEE